MGRYYNGMIQGKFWFAVQPSNDGEFFGAEERDSNIVNYYVDDIDFVKDKVKECKETLLITDTAEWQARLELGENIMECIEEHGYCEFEAEL